LILIVNENKSDNLGDHAINKGMVELFGTRGYHTKSFPFATFSNGVVGSEFKEKKNYTLITHLIKLLVNRLKGSKIISFIYWYYSNKKNIHRAIREPEVGEIVIGGGQLILSNKTFAIALYTWVKLSHQYGKKVSILGVGCGESFSFLERVLFRRALKSAHRVYVREPESLVKIRKNFSIRSYFIPDFAFALKERNCEGSKSNQIVVSVTDFSVYVRYKDEVNCNKFSNKSDYLLEWARLTSESLLNSNTKIILASTTNSDAEISTELYTVLVELGLDNPIEDLGVPESLLAYRDILATSKIVISGRMHSLILGKVEACDVTPWIISKKVENFLLNYSSKSSEDYCLELNKIMDELYC